MNVDSIHNGVVIDHIIAGRSMRLYDLLGLDKLNAPVAIIKNVNSCKMGKKDLIKVDADIPINLEVIGFVDPGATVNIIKNGILTEKRSVPMPETLINVIKCKNPRCITSTEQELDNIMRLTDRKNVVYRCVYCEATVK